MLNRFGEDVGVLDVGGVDVRVVNMGISRDRLHRANQTFCRKRATNVNINFLQYSVVYYSAEHWNYNQIVRLARELNPSW